MKLSWFMFGLLIAMCLVVTAALVMGEDSMTADDQRLVTAHGFEHDEYKTMQQGGPSTQRFDRVEVLAVAFALLQVAFLVSCVAFGVGRNKGGGASRWPIVAGGVLFAAVFGCLFVAYRHYAGDKATPLVGAFPLPTAIMLYGLWAAPLVFVALYFFKFNRWVITEEDMARFREIVESKRRNEQEGD